jgi:nucleoside-diphosphate-sugar epimerase
MARAIDWAIKRDLDGREFLAVNIGCSEWNYQVKDLAEAVAQIIPDLDISINKNAQPDKRSYRVSFDLFKKLAPDFQPTVDLISTIKELKSGLEAMKFNDINFRNSHLMRLNVLNDLMNKNLLTEKLEWSNNHHK